MVDAYRFIISTAPDSLAVALDEVRFRPHEITHVELAPGVALIEIEQAAAEWEAALREKPPVFVRHIMPVDREVVIEHAPEDVERFVKVALNLAKGFVPDQPFAVQTRFLANDPLPYTRFEINKTISEALEAEFDLRLDVPHPWQVISVAITDDRAYIGASPVEFNRSAWAGGEHRFAREEHQLSRAEFKLLEAQAIFGFEFPSSGLALDLGAAPGGWTRLLRRAGMRVVAVDPAEMHPSLAADRHVMHEQMLAQEFLPTAEQYDMVLNDIRMDARDVAFLMKDAAPSLKPGGIAVLTLKLPHEHFASITYRALGILRSAYHLIGVRQLFHNRSEVTVVMQRPDEA